MNQFEAISQYNKDNRMKVNPALFARSDEDILRELENVILSCQRHNEYFTIRVESFTVVDDYAEIHSILNKFYEDTTRNKNKNKKRDNQYAYINLKDSDIRLLIVKYFIKDKDEEDYLTVYIEVPRIVEKYYFRISGGLYSALYQIVDGSTYNNATSNAKNPSITLKIIFMATRVYRYFQEMKTTENEVLKVTHYSSRIFNKSISAMKYILAKFGYAGTLGFLGIRDVFITQTDPKRKDWYTFEKSEDLFISAPKILFDNDFVTQSLIACVYRALVPGMPFQEIFGPTFWIRSLGGEFNNTTPEKMLCILNPNDDSIPDTIGKGYSIMDSFESIYDISTKASIRLPEDQKADMYCVMRWMMREFNQLRMKDNLDVSIKKIRCAEYIASLYAMKIAKGIYRVADLNKRASLNNIRKAINTAPNMLMKAMTRCKLINYRTMVNDMDSMSALKFTYKGVSGLGEASSNSIPNIYRTIHPSHLGRIDLDSSSATDPGVTGTICPFADIYDGCFSNYQEPNYWEGEFATTVDEYIKSSNLIQILEFKRDVLNKDVKEEIALAKETNAMMQQLIKPIIFMDDQQEIITVPIEEELYNGE